MRKIFITATDTGAGKTFVTAQLTRILHRRGIRVRALKPVACGAEKGQIHADVAVLMRAQEISDPGRVCLYSFAMPAAPGIAAAAEKRRIEPEKLIRWCEEMSRDADICLIEGIGGLMVPLVDHFLVCDWLAGLPEVKTLLVAGARLGAINHSLLTLNQLRAVRRDPDWIAVNCPETGLEQSVQHLRQVLAGLVPACDVVTIPHLENSGRDAASFVRLADHMIDACITNKTTDG
ncbi:MAG: dethiobiotin synthase [Mariprofundaceae bacterium]|nr:dethiobiotin synthase [Mariprofundaceae bacterium]